jgi:hypothetical protein
LIDVHSTRNFCAIAAGQQGGAQVGAQPKLKIVGLPGSAIGGKIQDHQHARRKIQDCLNRPVFAPSPPPRHNFNPPRSLHPILLHLSPSASVRVCCRVYGRRNGVGSTIHIMRFSGIKLLNAIHNFLRNHLLA